MKKRSRNLLAILLTMVMLAAECSTAFAATAGREKQAESDTQEKSGPEILKAGEDEYNVELVGGQIVYDTKIQFIVTPKDGTELNGFSGAYVDSVVYNGETMDLYDAYRNGLKPGDKIDINYMAYVEKQSPDVVTGTDPGTGWIREEFSGIFKDVPVVKYKGTAEDLFGVYPCSYSRGKKLKNDLNKKKLDGGWGTYGKYSFDLTDKGLDKLGDLSEDEYELEYETDFTVSIMGYSEAAQKYVDISGNYEIDFTGYSLKIILNDLYNIKFDITEIQVGRSVDQFEELLKKHAHLYKNDVLQQWDSSNLSLSINTVPGIETMLATENSSIWVSARGRFKDGDKEIDVNSYGSFIIRKNAYNMYVDPFEEVASATGASYDRTLHDLMVNAYAVKNESEKVRIGSLGEGESLFFKTYDENDDRHGSEDSEFFKTIRPGDEYQYRLVWYIPSEKRRISLSDYLKFFAYDPQNDTANPANPYAEVHKTDGSDVEALPENAAPYVFDPVKSSTVIAAVPVNITKKFESYVSYNGYEESAKHRYTVDNKKIATVDKKGNIKPKKTGTVKIWLEQKVKGSGWTKIGDPVEMFVQVPTMKKSETVAVGEKLNAKSFVSKTTFAPTKWISSKPAVAEVDPVTGEIIAKKKGSAKIIAVYGDDNKNSKKKYKTKLKVS